MGRLQLLERHSTLQCVAVLADHVGNPHCGRQKAEGWQSSCQQPIVSLTGRAVVSKPCQFHSKPEVINSFIQEKTLQQAYMWYRIIARPSPKIPNGCNQLVKHLPVGAIRFQYLHIFSIRFAKRHCRAWQNAGVGASSGSGWLSAGCCAAVQGASLSGQMRSSQAPLPFEPNSRAPCGHGHNG